MVDGKSFLNLENFNNVSGIYFENSKAESLSGGDKLFFPEEALGLGNNLEQESFWHRHRGNCVVEAVARFGIPKGGFLVDVGGGNGYVAYRLMQAGINTVLCEPNRQGVVNAQKRGLTNLVCALFNEKTIKPNSVPAVGLFDVLEHIENEKLFLSSISQCMQDSGMLFCTVPAHSYLWSDKDDYAQHLRRYELKELVRVFKDSDFEVLYATYFFSVLPIPMFLFKALPYKLKHRHERSFNELSKEHKKSRANNLLTPIWQQEIKNIKNAKPINFGASCLVVARKKRVGG